MAKAPVDSANFDELIAQIIKETSSVDRKFQLVYYTNYNFSAQQIAHLLIQYKTAPERVRLISALEKRLCRMTCAEARLILESFQLTNNDRLVALDRLKRCLVDHQSTEGIEYILVAFPFPNDKLSAMGILATVSTYVAELMAAGGHQLYGAVGGLYSQSFPIRSNFYGPVETQLEQLPGKGEPCIAPNAKPGKVDSLYTSHPSYRYNNGVSWKNSLGQPTF